MYICADSQVLRISDETYWQQMSEGDQKSFERLFESYYGLLCRYAYTVLRSKEEAEEVVQNLFVSLWQKRERIVISSSVKTYLYSATRNECLNKLKHLKVRNAYATEIRHTAPVSGNGIENLEAKELRAKVDDAIASLPEQCASVFKLSRFEQLSYAEIASKMQISVKTVEAHIGKALKRMREQLKDFLVVLMVVLMIYLTK